MENIDFKKANEKRLKVLQEDYNANKEVIEKYLDKFQGFISEITEEGELQLVDLYRILAINIARVTTSTYHESEAEFQGELQLAHQNVSRFFKEFLKQGSSEANKEDFKVSRLMMFVSDLIETIMWNYFLSAQPEDKLNLSAYLEDETPEEEK